jgi:hypothetical protein
MAGLLPSHASPGGGIVARTRKLAVVAVAAGVATALGLGGATTAGSAVVDNTPPNIAVTVTGKPGANGWYIGNTTVRWQATDPESGIAKRTGCARVNVTAETTGRTITCTAMNNKRMQTSKSVVIALDKTPPSVAAAPDRGPDANGWYNHAVTVGFTASDAVSGVAACDAAKQYAGPDGQSISVTGACVDRAGHRAGNGFTFHYDATPTGAVQTLDATAGDHKVTLVWKKPVKADGLSGYVVTRNGPTKSGLVVYQGRNAAFVDTRVANGVKLRYQVQALDQAGNRSAAKTAVITANVQLLVTPKAGVKITAPPLLRWAPYRSPHYYNVQLWRGGGKILSAWPTKSRFKLPFLWRYNGRNYRLSPGRYRWYVFPGYGARTQARYGKMIGTSTFRIVSSKRKQ